MADGHGTEKMKITDIELKREILKSLTEIKVIEIFLGDSVITTYKDKKYKVDVQPNDLIIEEVF